MTHERAGDELTRRADEVAHELDGRALACAESCTAGLLTRAFATVDGASEWFRGGVVAYQRPVKEGLLDIPTDAHLVSRAVAEAMAEGVAKLMAADVTVSTTGAVGPAPLDGVEPGTMVVGAFVDGVTTSIAVTGTGSPDELAHLAARTALDELLVALRRARPG
jgi:nicotinamide-nucleotide amidase